MLAQRVALCQPFRSGVCHFDSFETQKHSNPRTPGLREGCLTALKHEVLSLPLSLLLGEAARCCTSYQDLHVKSIN
jgi:hypothetical protein